jgi:hypothetical protein
LVNCYEYQSLAATEGSTTKQEIAIRVKAIHDAIDHIMITIMNTNERRQLLTFMYDIPAVTWVAAKERKPYHCPVSFIPLVMIRRSGVPIIDSQIVEDMTIVLRLLQIGNNIDNAV